MKNKFIVASAWSGKTRYIIEESLKVKDRNVLITTFTEANEREIRSKIISEIWYIPSNICIQTWFSFLLQHWVRPYQDAFFVELHSTNIWFHLVDGTPNFWKPKSTLSYYFTNWSDRKIRSDKISDFVITCNTSAWGKVVSRISSIYSHIFVDEVQDMAGYDLDFLVLLMKTESFITLVGDPRQGTYSTSNWSKNKKFQKSEIVEYFKNRQLVDLIDIDTTSFLFNFRCNQAICNIADTLFPEHTKAISKQTVQTQHDGIFFISQAEIPGYLEKYPECVQLRDSKRENRAIEWYQIMNFGASKWLTFDRVLIFPTTPIAQWIKNNDSELKSITRSKLYVALTRAKYSVCFLIT
jgi:DNA helicase II / ATP-dependent DNA helicase PcrA